MQTWRESAPSGSWVEFACRNPTNSTLNGTFEEVLAFLTGVYSGMSARSRTAADLPAEARLWMEFYEFLADRVGCSEAAGQARFRVLREKYPDDRDALRQLLALYHEFLERRHTP